MPLSHTCTSVSFYPSFHYVCLLEGKREGKREGEEEGVSAKDERNNLHTHKTQSLPKKTDNTFLSFLDFCFLSSLRLLSALVGLLEFFTGPFIASLARSNFFVCPVI